jgi:excisionase family DNA binding protein
MKRPNEARRKKTAQAKAAAKRRGSRAAAKMRPESADEGRGPGGTPQPSIGQSRVVTDVGKPPTAARLLTYAEASALTGWALGTLYAMVARRQIDHVRLGPRSVRFRAEDIDRLVLEGYRAKAT